MDDGLALYLSFKHHIHRQAAVQTRGSFHVALNKWFILNGLRLSIHLFDFFGSFSFCWSKILPIYNKKSHLAVSITGQLETSGQKKICCQLNWIWMLKKEYIWIITLSAYQLIVCIKTLYFVKYGIENLISKVCIFYELLRGYLFL